MYWYIPMITVTLMCAVFILKIRKTYKTMTLNAGKIFFKSSEVSFEESQKVINKFQEKFYEDDIKFKENFSNVLKHILINYAIYTVATSINLLTDMSGIYYDYYYYKKIPLVPSVLLVIVALFNIAYASYLTFDFFAKRTAFKKMKDMNVRFVKYVNKNVKTVFALIYLFRIYIILTCSYSIVLFSDRSFSIIPFGAYIFDLVIFGLIQLAAVLTLFISLKRSSNPNKLIKKAPTKVSVKEETVEERKAKIKGESKIKKSNSKNLKAAIAVLAAFAVIMCATFSYFLWYEHNQVAYYQNQAASFEEKVNDLELDKKIDGLNSKSEKSEFFILCSKYACILDDSQYYHTPTCEDIKDHQFDYTAESISTLQSNGYVACNKCYRGRFPLIIGS